MTKIVTSASMVLLIKTHGAIRVIGHAVVALYRRQTDDEKDSNETVERNGRGFTGYDARVGSLTAKHYLATATLQPWMIKYWMKETKAGYPKICRYAKQLNQVANERAAQSPVH